MRKKLHITLGFIILITAIALTITLPQGPDFKIGKFERELKIHQGLDLKGGTHLVYELDTSHIDAKDQSEAENGVKNVIERRINGLGVSEAVIQSSRVGTTSALIVELPGISDVKEAIDLIGKTAQLTFKEENPESGGDYNNYWKESGLNGSHLKRAYVEFDQQGKPQVALQFDEKGKELFSEITRRNLQKPVAIELDGELISVPTVQSEITQGTAVITGDFKLDEAKKLALELNSGALPVSVKLVEQRSIGATLGTESVKKSLMAGLFGLLMVVIFMIAHYRLPGLIAIGALFIYSLIVVALFKIIPVTLTLAGVAGYILSIGMAVDANILIFERMKEEKMLGKSIQQAIDDGFRRAWSSIRDSNISTLITCTILFWLGTGLVRGFALTLAIGVLVSMFSAITVSRTFLKLTLKEKAA